MTAAAGRDVAWQPLAIAAITAAVLAIVVGTILVVVAEPTFRASTSVSIRPRIADLGAAEAAARLVRNYAAWVNSEAYAARLGTESRGGLSDAEIVARVRTNGDSDRLLVRIQAEDEMPGRAAAIVNGLASALVAEVATPERVDDPEKGLEIAVVDEARPPTQSVWPRAEVILPVAAIVGAVVGAAMAWLVSPMAARSERGRGSH